MDDANTPDLEFDKIVFGENLTHLEKNALSNLISGYRDIFAINPKKPSRTNLLSHEIITTNVKPMYGKPRRIPLAWENEGDTQVKEMLRNHIIRESKSPWNAPILLVKKKDQTVGFVCDFRELNEVTKKDTYPLPQIKDVIDKMQGARYWTTLDVASAYWSILLHETDKEKTAFSVPGGKFEFEVMPYGLCNAGASYQRMLNMCLAGLSPERV